MREKTLCKRNEFLKIAKELFFEKGYSNVSIKEICQNLNTTTGSFYFMFPSKEKLLEELIFEDFNPIFSLGEKLVNSKKDLKYKLNEYLSKTIDFASKEIELYDFYENLMKENGIGGKTANELKIVSFQKKQEHLYRIIAHHKDEDKYDNKKINDLAKYALLILENKEYEIVNKIKNNEPVDKNEEKDFLAKAITGLLNTWFCINELIQ